MRKSQKFGFGRFCRLNFEVQGQDSHFRVGVDLVFSFQSILVWLKMNVDRSLIRFVNQSAQLHITSRVYGLWRAKNALIFQLKFYFSKNTKTLDLTLIPP